ncbi:MAG: DUF2062 domain-containing protein [Prevotellaceae bacterium]|nr:DUF2062 domain-containing protein [Prevotellaceae bacterium]
MFTQKELKQINCCILIPTYNNAGTIRQVATDALQYCEDVFVINDGSTDNTLDILHSMPDIRVVSYAQNKGKGNALKTGIKAALEAGFRYAVTIDSDGQHFTEDIPLFVEKIKENPDSFIVGCRNFEQENMPGKNTFANKFSNFWFKLETGFELPDTQCGFRLYPVKKLEKMYFLTGRYEFELEVLVRAAWKNIPVIPLKIKVYYAPEEERVSHFRPLRDFTRISFLNAFLVIIAFLWVKPFAFFRSLTRENIKTFLRRNFTESRDSNLRLASAAGFGVFMGIVPIWGYQMLVAFGLAHVMKLNKWIVLVFSNISIPPMIPFILFGSYVTGGFLLGNSVFPQFHTISFEVVAADLLQYLLGAVVFALICGALAWLATFVVLSVSRKKRS